MQGRGLIQEAVKGRLVGERRERSADASLLIGQRTMVRRGRGRSERRVGPQDLLQSVVELMEPGVVVVVVAAVRDGDQLRQRQ